MPLRLLSMRVTISALVALAKWASVSFTGRPAARATIASASLRSIARPPPKGSITTWAPSTAAATTKCAGRPTPSTASAARPRSISASGRRRRSPNSLRGSAARGVMDPRRRERRPLQLLGELERASRRPRGGGLRLVRRGEAQEQRPPELVVVAFVRLDHIAVHRRGLLVAGCLAELDELAVLDDRDRLARELPGRHALDGGQEPIEVLEERAVALGQRVERPGIEAERPEPVCEHPVVLGLVANLSREREPHVHLVGRHEPARRDFRGLDLVLERDLEQVQDVEGTVHLGLEGVVRGQAAQESLVLRVEAIDELFRGHDPIPSLRSAGSSCVSVSLVTTRRQRACHGWVWRASACVVKPRTGTRAPSAAKRRRS